MATLLRAHGMARLALGISALARTAHAHGGDEDEAAAAMALLAANLSPFASLLLFCLVMALSTFVLGSLPLFVRLSHRQMVLLQSLAAGLLLGAGITIVLPEGVANLYAQQPKHRGSKHADKKHDFDPEHVLGLSVLVGFLLMYFVDRIFSAQHRHFQPSARPAPPPPAARPHSYAADTATSSSTAARRARSRSESHLMAANAGSYSSYGNGSTSSTNTPLRIGGLRLFFRLPRFLRAASSRETHDHDHDAKDAESDSAGSLSSFSRSSLTSLLGLCIHALADGVAMGATSLTPSAPSPSSAAAAVASLPATALAFVRRQHSTDGTDDPDAASSLRLIVFLAIMLHKAPAALGLSTLLLAQAGATATSRLAILRAIALFSLSTPLGALATYALGYWIFQSGHIAAAASADGVLAAAAGSAAVAAAAEEGEGAAGGGGLSSRHIGMALTFSAGTFLYVAMHALGELMGGSPSGSHDHERQPADGHGERGSHDHIYEIGEDDEEEEGDDDARRHAVPRGANTDDDNDGAHEPLLDSAGDASASSPRPAAASSSSSAAPGTAAAQAAARRASRSPHRRQGSSAGSMHIRREGGGQWSSVLTVEVAKTILLLVGAGVPRFLQTLTGGHGH